MIRIWDKKKREDRNTILSSSYYFKPMEKASIVFVFWPSQ